MWLKTTPWAQAPEVCEKTFSTYFIPQPVENTLTYSQIFVKDNQDNQVTLLDKNMWKCCEKPVN